MATVSRELFPELDGILPCLLLCIFCFNFYLKVRGANLEVLSGAGSLDEATSEEKVIGVGTYTSHGMSRVFGFPHSSTSSAVFAIDQGTMNAAPPPSHPSGDHHRTWTYVAWWILLFVLHVVNIVYYVGSAVFYKEIFNTNLAFQLMTYSIGIAEKQYHNVSAVLIAVAVVHMCCLVMMVGSSISARRLEFYPKLSLYTIMARLRRRLRRSHRSQQNPKTSQQSQRRLSSASHIVIESAGRSVSFVFGRDGLLGVDSVYFDDILVVRELFETGLQSYQAYRMTQLLPRLGLIRVYVALLVMNCWCVPLLHSVYKEQHLKRRMTSLLCDAILDMVSSMGITLLIFATYAPQYTDPAFGFPFVNWFNDQWFTSVYQEFQMMLVVSWGDMASRLVFALGLLQCMETVKEILEPVPVKPLVPDAKPLVKPLTDPAQEKQLANETSLQPVSMATKSVDSVVTAVVSPVLASATATAGSEVEAPAVRPVEGTMVRPAQPQSRLHRVKHFILHKVAPVCFVLWGCVILVVHIYAESKGTDWPCSLRLRPWFSSKPACSLVEINCFEMGVSGNEASFEAAWTKFEPGLTAHMTVRHCPQLVAPPAIGQYHRLTSMKVYNSSIVAWPDTAAITTKSHSALRALYFLRTEFPNATLPPGLTSTNFPQSFRSFVASGTNLASLAVDLDQSWPQYISIALEGCQFTAVPEVLMRLQPMLLSLSVNPLASVPVSLFEIHALETLLLVDTLIQELPREVTNVSPRMYLVMLSGTNVSTLWSWMDPVISRAFAFHNQFFNAQGTRFCAEREAIEACNRTQFSAADTIPMAALASVMDLSTRAWTK